MIKRVFQIIDVKKGGSRKPVRVGTKLIILLFMKKILLLAFLSLTTIFVACKKDESPADNDVFVGAYKGKISYNKEGENKSADNGSVTVVKAGDTYYFSFSDGIKDLSGVELKKDSETLLNVDFKNFEAQYINVTAKKLRIHYTKDGATWTANAER